MSKLNEYLETLISRIPMSVDDIKIKNKLIKALQKGKSDDDVMDLSVDECLKQIKDPDEAEKVAGILFEKAKQDLEKDK